MGIRIVDNPGLLEWMKRTHRLTEKLKEGDQLFGPFSARGFEYQVRYIDVTETWELAEILDDYFEAFPERRIKVVQLANEHRGKMDAKEFVRFLIQATIATGITKREDILQTVELAANLEAVQLSANSSTKYWEIPTEYNEGFIKKTLDQGRGRLPHRHLWWVDEDRMYHLFDG